MGASAWRIVNKHMEERLVSRTQFVPGWDKYQSSYRIELMGVVGTIVFVNLVTVFFHLEEGQTEATCHGIEAIRAIWLYGKNKKCRQFL
jgi:hypothetical protein